MDKIVTFDLETKGKKFWEALAPWSYDFEVQIAAWSEGRDGEVKAKRIEDDTEFLMWVKRELEDADVIWGWNLVYDVACILAVAGRNSDWFDYDALRKQLFSKRYSDGMLLWQRTTEMWRTFAKNELFEKWTPALSYGLKAYATEHNWIYTEKDFASLEYAKHDVDFTRKAIINEGSKLPQNQIQGYMQECKCIPVLAEQWVRGIIVDKEALRELGGQARAKMLNAAKSLGVLEDVLRSDAKKRKLIYEDWGLECPCELNGKEIRTASGALPTNKLALRLLLKQDKRIQYVIDYQKAKTQYTKFFEATVKALKNNGNGRVYVPHRIASTYTGRMTVNSKTSARDEKGSTKKVPTGIALHQWQSDPLVRNLLRPPEGHTLVEFDAAGQEMRLMAHLSGDETMTDLFQKGMSAHAVMAAQFSGEPYQIIMDRRHVDPAYATKYKIGKVANLSLQYRTSWNRMAMMAMEKDGTEFEVHEAKLLRQTYIKTYPGVKQFWDKQVDEADTVQYVEALDGRRLKLGKKVQGDWRKESAAINFPIQSSGAAMKYFALSEMRDVMVQYDAYFAWDLHDGIFFYVPDEAVEEFCKTTQAVLDGLDYSTWNWTPAVPMLWEGAYGKRWGEMVEL
jgi:DNA polymerase-1